MLGRNPYAFGFVWGCSSVVEQSAAIQKVHGFDPSCFLAYLSSDQWVVLLLVGFSVGSLYLTSLVPSLDYLSIL